MINSNDLILMLKVVGILFSLLVIFKACICVLQKTQHTQGKKIEYFVNLKNVVAYKEQMDGERTSNHQFDETKTFSEKLNVGSDSLEEYKRKNDASICKNYRMG